MRSVTAIADNHIHLAALIVQSSLIKSIPEYLIIPATNIQLANSIGQGKEHTY